MCGVRGQHDERVFHAASEFPNINGAQCLSGLQHAGYTDFLLDTIDTFSKAKRAEIYGKADEGHAIKALSHPLYGDEAEKRMDHIWGHLESLTSAQKAALWVDLFKSGTSQKYSEELFASGMGKLKERSSEKFGAFALKVQDYFENNPGAYKGLVATRAAGAPEAHA